MNGSALVHDFEIAMAGTTSEDVEAQLARGRFGLAEETGALLNKLAKFAQREEIGLGEAAGKFLASGQEYLPEDFQAVLQVAEAKPGSLTFDWRLVAAGKNAPANIRALHVSQALSLKAFSSHLGRVERLLQHRDHRVAQPHPRQAGGGGLELAEHVVGLDVQDRAVLLELEEQAGRVVGVDVETELARRPGHDGRLRDHERARDRAALPTLRSGPGGRARAARRRGLGENRLRELEIAGVELARARFEFQPTYRRQATLGR